MFTILILWNLMFCWLFLKTINIADAYQDDRFREKVKEVGIIACVLNC